MPATLESKTIKQGVLELVVSIPVEAMKPYLEQGAVELQKKKPVAGFRPGKAPYEAVVQNRGEMAVWEAASQHAIASTFAEILSNEHFDTIGEPEVQLLKLAPAQPVQYSVRVALRPEVKLGDYKQIRVKTQEVKIPEEEVDRVIDELRDTRATDAKVDRPATKQDRVVVDLNMTLGAAPIEGGQTTDHAIDLFRPYFIEGFSEQIVGLKEGEQKTFSLNFPSEHFDKKLAGQKVDFAVKIKAVKELKRPDINDDFAKSIGKFNNMAELKGQVENNLKDFQQVREDQRLEREIIEAIIKQASFGDIPALLIEAEIQKIFWRLKNQVESEGGSWNDYLEHIKKTPEQLIGEWRPEATTRVKALLIVRQIAEAEKIAALPDEIEEERKTILAHYQKEDEADIRQEIQSQDYNRHLNHLIVTRRVMDLLKKIATA